MPPSPTAPADADALRQIVQQAVARARFPVALQALLLALLSAILGRRESIARMGRVLHPTPIGHPACDPLPAAGRSKAANRLRAWIGWILRFAPGLGMAPTGARLAPPCPTRIARAPPRLE